MFLGGGTSCSFVQTLLLWDVSFSYNAQRSQTERQTTVSCQWLIILHAAVGSTKISVWVQRTCAVAEVGKTSMCVHELSLGVEIGRRVRWLSSGFTASIMMWMLGWSSVDMTQALMTHGTAVSLSWRQVMHASLNFSLQLLKLRRLRIADHPKIHYLKLWTRFSRLRTNKFTGFYFFMRGHICKSTPLLQPVWLVKSGKANVLHTAALHLSTNLFPKRNHDFIQISALHRSHKRSFHKYIWNIKLNKIDKVFNKCLFA